MSDRKYRQSGYQDSGKEQKREPRREPGPKQPKGSRDGPRPIRMPGFQEVLRCAMCGAVVPPLAEIRFESQCPKCSTDLRCCKNCRHFDTSARWECTQPIPERITKKDIRNQCEFFVGRTSIERETRDSGGSLSPAPSRPADARSAFDSLFKK
ncbi:MAG TPA: hypothetical protein VFY29_12745 [Terriglobia bacterium]|nr:hypothetical protein [Terriglobia bacterium]